MPEPLAGKTLGIIGLGTIGTDLAHKAGVLGMRVIGVKRTPEPVPGVDAVHTLDQLDVVLAQSDFVVLLLPVTPATENVVNAGALYLDGVLAVATDRFSSESSGDSSGVGVRVR